MDPELKDAFGNTRQLRSAGDQRTAGLAQRAMRREVVANIGDAEVMFWRCVGYELAI